MTDPVAAFFWRKLDTPGHDSCRLLRHQGGWRLSGAAVFLEARRACHFQYEVVADAAFLTQSARVSGYLGKAAIDIRIRSAGRERWRVDGAPATQLTGCLDIDLGFTPATNLLAIRRLRLEVGQSAEAPAAYLGFPSLRFTRLPQRYQRIGRNEYAYESPTFGYAGTLRVARSGAVVHYPELFELIGPAR